MYLFVSVCARVRKAYKPKKTQVEKRDVSNEVAVLRMCMSDRFVSFGLRIRLSRHKWIIVTIVNKYNERNPCDWATFSHKKVKFKFRGFEQRQFHFHAIQVINRR